MLQAQTLQPLEERNGIGGESAERNNIREEEREMAMEEEDDQLLPIPIQRSNTLHLSVGAPSDEEDDEDDDCGAGGVGMTSSAMRASVSEWQRRNAPMGSMASPGHEDAMILPVPDEDAPFVVARSIEASLLAGEDDANFASALHDILQSGERLFQPLGDANNLVEESWAPKAPKIVRGYLFGGLIGEGSYAKVKEVVEEHSLVRRAVKIIKETRLRKIPNGKENVERELRILKKVSHANVIRLIETFRDDAKNKLYMILEYCVSSLQQILDSTEQKLLPMPECHYYFTQLIMGLAYLQSVGIVHKDIKPGNLLVSRSRVLKISDFGVAEQLSPYQATDEIENAQGTPKFQPPEAVSGSCSSYGGFAADVWACGVTLYNMVSGEYPFEGAVIMKLYEAIVQQPLSMPTTVKVDDDTESLLRNLLEKNPKKRWTIGEVEECSWMRQLVDKISFTPFPPHRDDPPHRPLTVVPSLQMMYMGEEEEMEMNQVPPTVALPPDVSSCHTRALSGDYPVPPSCPPRTPRRTRSFIPSCLRGHSSP